MAWEGSVVSIQHIVSEEEMTLRELLMMNDVLEDVEAGIRIVLWNGSSLMDLDAMVPPGQKLVVVSVGALGGG
jgi:hypothetical protein